MLPHASPAAAAPPDKVPGALVLASAGALLSAGVGHKVPATASQGGAAASLVHARGAATRGAEPHSVAPGALREGCPNQQSPLLQRAPSLQGVVCLLGTVWSTSTRLSG